MLHELCRAGVHCISANNEVDRHMSYTNMVASIIAFIVTIVIIAFVGQFVWNASVAELFTFARPVRSVWQIIALLILVSLFR